MILSFLRGEFTKRAMLRYCLPAYAILPASLLFLSSLSYPNYNPVRMDISFLGVPNENPKGWFFWALAMALQGLAAFPAITHMGRRMGLADRRFGIYGAYAFAASSAGLLTLGLLPQIAGLETAHIASGTLAMGGAYLGLLMWLRPILFNGACENRSLLPAFLFFIFIGPAGFLSTQGYRVLAGGVKGYDLYDPACPWPLCFSLWEWTLFAGLTLSFLLLLLLSPSEEAPAEKEDSEGSSTEVERFVALSSKAAVACAAAAIVLGAMLAIAFWRL